MVQFTTLRHPSPEPLVVIVQYLNRIEPLSLGPFELPIKEDGKRNIVIIEDSSWDPLQLQRRGAMSIEYWIGPPRRMAENGGRSELDHSHGERVILWAFDRGVRRKIYQAMLDKSRVITNGHEFTVVKMRDHAWKTVITRFRRVTQHVGLLLDLPSIAHFRLPCVGNESRVHGHSWAPIRDHARSFAQNSSACIASSTANFGLKIQLEKLASNGRIIC
ncbi:hypothetical protein DFH06DRAFT_1135956 [Mycena polygramma]|nr:hypothetical protein DFH06DRAFT_1135956 [Mycena polygramma]